jgi:hypothetical protein
MAALLLAAALSMPTGGMPSEPPKPNVPKTAASQTGIAPSAYRGKYYRNGQEPYRMCVAQREGRGQYWVTGSNGFYLGTYQMTHALARGAVWMMTPELKATYGARLGKQIRDQLHNTHPTKWHRFYWDMAFYTVLNWKGDGRGAKHWRGGRFSCQIGMKHYGGAR